MHDDLEGFLEEGKCPERRRALREAASRVGHWEREHPQSLDAILDWIEQLQGLFGEQPPDMRPWRGSDFRL